MNERDNDQPPWEDITKMLIGINGMALLTIIQTSLRDCCDDPEKIRLGTNFIIPFFFICTIWSFIYVKKIVHAFVKHFFPCGE